MSFGSESLPLKRSPGTVLQRPARILRKGSGLDRRDIVVREIFLQSMGNLKSMYEVHRKTNWGRRRGTFYITRVPFFSARCDRKQKTRKRSKSDTTASAYGVRCVSQERKNNFNHHQGSSRTLVYHNLRCCKYVNI